MARILVAEDDAAERTLLMRALKADGHEVIAVDDGQAALAQLTANPSAIDLVVSDVEMPMLDGVSLAQRAIAARADIKVLLISGHQESLDRAKALNAPGVRSLAKPASLEVVRAEVGKMLA
ncbi:MAG: response regulator [Hyphomicrobiaceae bacterium]